MYILLSQKFQSKRSNLILFQYLVLDIEVIMNKPHGEKICIREEEEEEEG